MVAEVCAYEKFIKSAIATGEFDGCVAEPRAFEWDIAAVMLF